MRKEDAPAPLAPGEVLREIFLAPLKISSYRLAKRIGVPETRISQILKGKRAITPDTALRLGRFFGCDPVFWLEAQNQWDLYKLKKEIGEELDAIRPYEPLDAQVPTGDRNHLS